MAYKFVRIKDKVDVAATRALAATREPSACSYCAARITNKVTTTVTSYHGLTTSHYVSSVALLLYQRFRQAPHEEVRLPQGSNTRLAVVI